MAKKGGDLHTAKRKAKNTIKDIGNFVKAVTKGEPISLKRKVGIFPPKIRKMLEIIGNEHILNLMVARAPIQSFVKNLLNVISLGQYEKAVHDSNYDNMFHLSLIINDRYVLDKQAVLSLVEGNKPNNAEIRSVNLRNDITIYELLENTKKYMGDKQFSNYDAHTNNCQDFILSVLQANDILTSDLTSFIKQDADSVFNKMPTLSERIGKFLTDAGATADRVIQGEGEKPSKKTTKVKPKTLIKKNTAWLDFVSKNTKGKKFNNVKEARDNLKKLSIEYKKLKN